METPQQDPNGVEVYFHLSYTVQTLPNDDLEGEPFIYVADFNFNEIPDRFIRTYITEEDMFVLHQLTQATGEVPTHKNISNLFYILKSLKPGIKSIFLTRDKYEDLILRFTILVPNKSLLIVNFDITTGIVLSRLFGAPISVTKDVFEEFSSSIADHKDEDDDD